MNFLALINLVLKEDEAVFYLIAFVTSMIFLYFLVRYIVLPLVKLILVILVGSVPYILGIFYLEYLTLFENYWIAGTVGLRLVYAFSFIIVFFSPIKFYHKVYISRNNYQPQIFNLTKDRYFRIWLVVVTILHFSIVSNLMTLREFNLSKSDFVFLGYVILLILLKMIYLFRTEILIVIIKTMGFPRQMINKIRKSWNNHLERKYYYRNTLNTNYHDIQYSIDQKEKFAKLAEEEKVKWNQARKEIENANSEKNRMEAEVIDFKKQIEEQKQLVLQEKKNISTQIDELEKKLKEIQTAKVRAEQEAKDAQDRKRRFENEAEQAAKKADRIKNKVVAEFVRTGKMNYEMAINILNLNEGFLKSDLKKSYNHQIRMNHPDKIDGMSEELKTIAAEITKALNSAYDFLKDYAK